MAIPRLAQLSICISLFCAVAQLAFGQSSVTGFPAFNTIKTLGIESINEGNLNVHLTIPLFHRPGFSHSIEYDSNFYVPFTNVHTGAQYWAPASTLSYGWNIEATPSSGWNPMLQGGVAGWWSRGFQDRNGVCYMYQSFAYIDRSGTQHLFPTITLGDASLGCNPGPITLGAIDGSGYTADFTFDSTNLVVNGSNLRDISGNLIVPATGTNSPRSSITDPNLNVVSIDASGNVTDPLGSAYSLSTTSTTSVFGYTGGNGPASVTVTYQTLTMKTNFGCGTFVDYASGFTAALPISIVYKDGATTVQSYGFKYDSVGRVKEVDLPTGGWIKYTYSGADCVDGTPDTLTRSVSPDGVSISTWTYSRSYGTNTSTTTITDAIRPTPNTTVVKFDTFGYEELQRDVYTGAASGTPLEEVIHCYNYGSAQPCGTATGPTSQTQANTSPQALSILRVFNDVVANHHNDNTTTYYGGVYLGHRLHLPTRVDYYDFSATSLSRQVITPYGTYNAGNGACTNPGTNILDRVCYVNIYGPSNGLCTLSNGTSLCASTWFTYDAKGNLSSKNVNAGINSAGTAWNILPTYYYYYGNGALKQVTDPNGTNTYYQTMTCGSGLFPTQITSSAVSWYTSETWDCSGGVMTSSTDPNGAKTTIYYKDALWRVTDVYAPWQNSQTTLIHTTYTNPNLFWSYQNVNGTSSQQQSLTDLDGLGRPLVKSTLAVGGPYSSVSYQYDADGRVSFVSNPCLSTNYSTPCSGLGTTYGNFDGLNRVGTITDGASEKLTQTYGFAGNKYIVLKQLPTVGPNTMSKSFQYDALGNLSSVCELSSSVTGYGACGYYGWTGYLTSYSYDPAGRLSSIVQNSQGSPTQTRSFTYDFIGRVLTESHPELGSTSSNGTITYKYDSQPGYCWNATSSGDLMSKTDAAGNVTCFLYDALHRATDAAGWTTTWQGPCRRYRYDNPANHVPNVTPPTGLTDYVGRLVEAETDSSCAWGATTDEWFSYADNGQLTDLYESTPNSGGYYHSSAAFYENGALSSLTPGITGNQVTVPWNFQLNQYAQPYSQSNSNGTILSSTTYNAAGQVTGVTHAQGDNEVFQYDGANRLHIYTFNIGTTPTVVSGTLNWNGDGTLGSLVISDGFVSGNTETCSYGYDSVVRVTSVTCNGTPAWGQTFGYDQFGNVNKSGNISWACTTCYDTKNHYNSALSGSISYDANGNLLNDTFHTYAWDANWGNPSTIDTTNLTYDALGRMVEYQNGTNAATQFMYGPTGIVAVMTGQTEIRSFEPFPAGGVFVHRPGSQTNYWRHPDWLGSSRFASTEPARAKFFDVQYAPYGEDYGNSGTTDLFFTGIEQDTTQTGGGLYDFAFRKYAPRQGRWVSPDPMRGNLGTPQTLNKYAYVTGNPLMGTDPLGLQDDQGNGEEANSNCFAGYCYGSVFVSGSLVFYGNLGIGAAPDLSGGTGQIPDLSSGDSGNTYNGPFSIDSFMGGGSAMGAGLSLNTGVAPGSRMSNGDVAAGALAQGVFQGNRALWNSAYSWGEAAFYGTGAVLAAPATLSTFVGLAAHGVGWYYGLTGGAGVVLGTYNEVPNYLDAAEQIGANALNIWSPLYNALNTFGEAWTANQAFLDASIFRGQQFYLSTNPQLASGTFWMELHYLASQGVGSSQWLMVSPYLSVH